MSGGIRRLDTRRADFRTGFHDLAFPLLCGQMNLRVIRSGCNPFFEYDRFAGVACGTSHLAENKRNFLTSRQHFTGFTSIFLDKIFVHMILVLATGQYYI